MLNLSLDFSSSKSVFLHNFCLDDKRESGLFKKKKKNYPFQSFLCMQSLCLRYKVITCGGLVAFNTFLKPVFSPMS